MNVQAKVIENRVRRALERVGLSLSRSRRRDNIAPDFGCYGVLDKHGNEVFGFRHGRQRATLAQIEAWVDARRARA